MYVYIMERKFRSQTSDNMDRWKSRGGKNQRREEKKREDQRRERVRRKKMQVREKVEKSRNTCVFPMICGSRGSKSRLAKVAGAEPSGQMRDDKLHAVVARSTFRSHNLQNASVSEHFWKLRCWKSARRFGAKQFLMPKCRKHTTFGPLLNVEMLNKCTPLWLEACFEVNMWKAHHFRATFGRSTAPHYTTIQLEENYYRYKYNYNNNYSYNYHNITLQLQLHYNDNYTYKHNYTTTTATNTTTTTLQIQLQAQLQLLELDGWVVCQFDSVCRDVPFLEDRKLFCSYRCSLHSGD